MVEPLGSDEYPVVGDDRVEHGTGEAVDRRIRSGRSIRSDGWRVDGGRPDDRDEAGRMLQEGIQ